ncbi:MAG: demethoxyubiquinone hydroxylase family protein [Nitrospinota bacterium]
MDYDISIIRPNLQAKDFKIRGKDFPLERTREIRKELIALHTLETMAANIYKFQITKEASEHNRQLITAMCNEMTHIQDFQVKLYEYSGKPSKMRWAYWIVGFVFGFFSRLIGTKAILKTGLWVETKAVQHYNELLKTVNWDEDTRSVIEKNQADEYGHLKRWQKLLGQEKEGKE